jgi:hypothetical protein
MDVRSVVLDLVAQDVLLNGLLDTGPGPARRDPDTGEPVAQTCYIVLSWTEDDQDGAPDEHRLTAQAYLPRNCEAEHPFLDFLLQRVWAVLAKGVADGLIVAERQAASRKFASNGFDSISKSGSFVVRPAPPQVEGRPPVRLVPGTGREGDAPRPAERGRATRSVS